MHEQVVTLEPCRWHFKDGSMCGTPTNHMFNTVTRKTGTLLEIPCCLKHQFDMSNALESHRDEMDEGDAMIERMRREDAREVYDMHSTERPTTYVFHPSAESKKRTERATKQYIAAQSVPTLAAELLAMLNEKRGVLALV